MIFNRLIVGCLVLNFSLSAIAGDVELDNGFQVIYAHYRPAKWEREQFVEYESELPNEGGLLYLYIKNVSDRQRSIRYWQYQNKDRTHWIQNNLVAWDRTWFHSLEPGKVTIIEINGISNDFAPGKPYRFTIVDSSWEPAMHHDATLLDDPLDISYIHVLPSMDELEVHLRHTGQEEIKFTDVSLQGLQVENVTWRGQHLDGSGYAIARVKLSEPVDPSTLLIVRVDGLENGAPRHVYAHRRAFADVFPIGTWGIDSNNYPFFARSQIDTGIRGGRSDDEFFGTNAAKFGLRAFVDVTNWPHNIDTLRDLSGHPAVLGWMLGDEPDRFFHCQQVLTTNDAVQRLDSSKPTMTTLCRNTMFMEFAPIVDWPCMDHYCVTAPTSSIWEHEYGGRLEETGFYTRDLKYAAEPKPTIVWSQGIHKWSERPKRGTPTGEELSVQLVQNLGNGSKGILWFTWRENVARQYPDLLKRAVEWNRIMGALRDDLLSSEPADLVVSAPEKVDASTLLTWNKIIVCVSNLDYQINDEAYKFNDKRNVTVTLQIPAWIKTKSAWLVSGNGATKLAMDRSSTEASVTLPHLHDAAILVLQEEQPQVAANPQSQ